MLKKLTLFLVLIAFMLSSTAIFAQKKKIAKVSIEISFNKIYLSYKGPNRTLIFLDTKKGFVVDKNEQIVNGTFEIKGSKIALKTRDKTYSIYMVNDTTLELDGETLTLEN